jgi:hypothetical protein
MELHLMDMNYLYWRRGVSLARARAATCQASAEAHLGLFEAYGHRIVARRSAANS